ncbi:type I-C CRISPR-associated protein Cas8c/Csd1 [Ruminiclostridium cellulolyticum]|uniref:type I-C CRISPR-associated protein Cas8c/Csd1 n=1 Tax=Ruminiclostridium cellulolyticum TaxID=1521 RepID=UPI0000E9484A|nr:type I-C CRISPR-associated protein Cas8c/Csd1 [Ruminiclostridium cellulolyticum]
MIIQSLVRYYEILAEDENSDIPRRGYSRTGVSYALNISKDGELLGVIPLKIPSESGKKMVPQRVTVPEQEKRAVGIKSNFLCENSSYSLGIDNNGKPDRTKKCFEAFKELHNIILEEVECAEAKAFLNYVNKWDMDNASNHIALKDCLEDITAGANIVFRLDGAGYIHQNKEIQKAWEVYKSNSESSKRMQCLDCGENANVARLHPNIKGVRGAQSVGAAIVSFNAKAYESYGREDEQGLNAPVSEYATFAYTTVLNSMIADNAHKQYLGDTTVVFWAESPQKFYQDIASLFIDPGELEVGENLKYARDMGAVKEVKAIFAKISTGAAIGDFLGAFDKNIKFYILGLAPNAARLSVRFFIVDSFGDFVRKVSQHYEDLRIEKQFESDKDIFSLWRLLNETVSPKSNDKAASPVLNGTWVDTPLGNIKFCLFGTSNMEVPFYVKPAPGLISFLPSSPGGLDPTN